MTGAGLSNASHRKRNQVTAGAAHPTATAIHRSLSLLKKFASLSRAQTNPSSSGGSTNAGSLMSNAQKNATDWRTHRPRPGACQYQVHASAATITDSPSKLSLRPGIHDTPWTCTGCTTKSSAPQTLRRRENPTAPKSTISRQEDSK